MAQHNDVGKWGEQLIVDRLVTEGYTIVERNWRMGHLEIDIIATRGEEIIFVEVKTRRDASHNNPLDAMTPKKIALLSRAANSYLTMTHCRLTPRFDVASITGSDHSPLIEYIPNAFLPPLRTY